VSVVGCLVVPNVDCCLINIAIIAIVEIEVEPVFNILQ
jgi:hypothetical protein